MGVGINTENSFAPGVSLFFYVVKYVHWIANNLIPASTLIASDMESPNVLRICLSYISLLIFPMALQNHYPTFPYLDT